MSQPSSILVEPGISNPNNPSPSDWSWEKDSSRCWQLLWTTLSQASDTCYKRFMQLQEGVQREVYMYQSCPEVHCTLFLWWRLYNYLKHSNILMW